MKRVKFNTAHNADGKAFNKGDEHEVDDRRAQLWVRSGVASYAKPDAPTTSETPPSPPAAEATA